MRTERSRKKKLIVAFHFQLGNQAGWKCEACRRNGLEDRRHCGWRQGSTDSLNQIVWARGGVSLTTCPTSYITAESLAFLEEFQAWKVMGLSNCFDLPARLVDAIVTLENELVLEKKDARV